MKQKSISLIDVKKYGHGKDYRVVYKLNQQEVERIISRSGVSNMKVAVISVAGKIQSGKSFLLEFFLRYAKHKYEFGRSDQDWMGSSDEDLLEGFRRSQGKVRETVGIMIWPHFFTCTVTGEKVCIILMDTQGSHDNEETWQEMAGIFALSTLTSSLQIYNVKYRLEERDLSHLERFCTHAESLAKAGAKPFQKALFLVRDWKMHGRYDYGFAGGNKYLEEEVFGVVKQPERLKTRHRIRTYFEDMACFLMPEAGQAGTDRGSFEGRLENLSKTFLNQIHQFVPSVLDAENLVLKKLYGAPVTVESLFGHLEWWVDRFNSTNLSVLAVMVNTSKDIRRLQFIDTALNSYSSEMDRFCRSRLHFSKYELFVTHVKAKESVLRRFFSEQQMQKEWELRTQRDKERLLDELELKYAEYLEQNRKKLFERNKIVFLPCVAVPVITLCCMIEQNSWLTSDLQSSMTTAIFWLSVGTMGYWAKLMFSWLLSDGTRTTVNAVFWILVLTQVYYQLIGPAGKRGKSAATNVRNKRII